MLSTSLIPIIKNIDDKIIKISGKTYKEEDIIIVLRDLRQVTDALEELYKNLSKGLTRFITKN